MDEHQKDELHARLLAQLLPVDDLEQALPHLRRPFSAEAVRFKVQSTWPKGPEKKGAIIVPYIDARLVIERLNAVAAAFWSAKYSPTSKADLMMCELTVFGTSRIDVGQSPKGLSKDLISDALKRAGVQFGVGVSVYALPQTAWTLEAAGGALKKIGGGEKASLALTPAGHASLKASYQDWLVDTGEPHFGPVLDHGDVDWVSEMPAEAPGDSESEDDGETPTAVPEPVSDAAGVMLREEVEAAYVALRDASKTALLPAAFQAELTAAQGSHAGLRELLVRLQDLTASAKAAA